MVERSHTVINVGVLQFLRFADPRPKEGTVERTFWGKKEGYRSRVAPDNWEQIPGNQWDVSDDLVDSEIPV